MTRDVPALGTPAELRQRRIRKIRMLIVLALVVVFGIMLAAAYYAGMTAGRNQQREIDRLARVLDGAN